MSLRLENKNALITGAASGICRATAMRFAEEGANVSVADRNLEAAEQVAAQVRSMGRKAIAHKVNVADEIQVDEMVARAVRELGGVDIAVVGAAIAFAGYGTGEDRHSSVLNKPLNEWREVMSVNLDGTFLTDRAAARAMVKAGKGGRIINISSIGAFSPVPNTSDYCASKAGVWTFTKALALELAQHDITVNAIAPGAVRTPMLANFLKDDPQKEAELVGGIPLRRMAEPRDIANAILFLASDEGSYCTGTLLHLNGGSLMV